MSAAQGRRKNACIQRGIHVAASDQATHSLAGEALWFGERARERQSALSRSDETKRTGRGPAMDGELVVTGIGWSQSPVGVMLAVSTIRITVRSGARVR